MDGLYHLLFVSVSPNAEKKVLPRAIKMSLYFKIGIKSICGLNVLQLIALYIYTPIANYYEYLSRFQINTQKWYPGSKNHDFQMETNNRQIWEMEGLYQNQSLSLKDQMLEVVQITKQKCNYI